MRKYLSPGEARRHAHVLEKILDEQLSTWQATGWALTGSRGRLRVTVLVPKKLARPHARAATIDIPKLGRLKVAVAATHEREPKETLGPLGNGPGVDYLAPGVALGADGERVGLAVTLALDGTPSLVTCGHAFSPGGGQVTTVDQQTVVANLTVNLFEQDPRTDAAICALTTDALTLLDRGKNAPSWCDRVHVPKSSDNGRPASFWPTWTEGRPPFLEDVTSFSSCAPATVGCGCVLLPACTEPGDSGSLLSFDGAYYGLASKRVGNFSYFTPIAAVLARIAAMGGSAQPWRP